MIKIEAFDMVHNQAGGLKKPNVVKKDQIVQNTDDVVEAKDPASVLQGVVEDHADIQNAQTESQDQLLHKQNPLLRIEIEGHFPY
jgi:hypothetical protein